MLKYGKRSDEVINRSVENMERLDKLLAATGKWSRKEAKALIKARPGAGGGPPAQRPGG